MTSGDYTCELIGVESTTTRSLLHLAMSIFSSTDSMKLQQSRKSSRLRHVYVIPFCLRLLRSVIVEIIGYA